MIPILFSDSATSFTTNGIGRLSDVIECVVTEERNGIYELEFEYPMNGAHYSEIAIRSIVVAKTSEGTLQAFRVYKIGRPINGRVKINCQHLSYDLAKNTSMPFSVTASSTACNTALQQLKTKAVETCPFAFWTDVNTVASYTQTVPAPTRQRLGGIEGSILDCFGGEYEWDNYTVKLHKNRGSERDITLRYGKNITDLEQEENIANTVTGVVPFWASMDGEQVVTLTEKAVYSSHATEYPQKMTVPLDLSQKWQEAPTESQLRTAAQVYVNKEGFGVPTVSTKVSFVNLAETEEYKDIIPLQNVKLCDIIHVQFEKLGISTTAKVVKTEYDVLTERYKSIEVGSLRSNLASTITDATSGTATAINDMGKRVYSEAVENATAWLTGSNGYVIAVKNDDGTWKEIIFADHKDPAEWQNLLRINENGLGFSSDGGRNYEQAWTLDGKLVVGGTNVPSITCVDANNNIIFKTTKDGTVWNSTNSSMTQDGTLTASGAQLTGGLITLGGTGNGRLLIKDNDGDVVGEWTKYGLTYTEIGSDYNHTIELKTYNNNPIIMFDSDSYIDGTGRGADGGIHLNAAEVVFSVSKIATTEYRNDHTLHYGKSGTLTDSYGTRWTFVNGLLTEIS